MAIAASSGDSSPALSAITAWSTYTVASSISVFISASANRAAWNEPTGWPNAVRSFTYSSVTSNAACAEETPAIAIDIRSCGEVGDQVEEPLALLPEQVVDGHVDVVEEQLRGVLRVHAELVEVAAALEALHAPLDDEQRDARGALASGRSSPR